MSFFNIFKRNKKKKEQEENVLEFHRLRKEQAKRQIEIIQDSIKLVNTSKNPGTFFSRYDLLIESLNSLAYIANDIEVEGDDPEKVIKELEDNKVDTFNSFINRYYEDVLLKIENLKTDKAKLNNADKFYNTLHDDYADYLEDGNKIEIDKLYKQLKESI